MIWLPIAVTTLLALVSAVEVAGHEYAPGDWQFIIPALAVKPGAFIAIVWIAYFAVRP